MKKPNDPANKISTHKTSVPKPRCDSPSNKFDDRDLVLTHSEAEAGSPADMATCGEEDPGSGLESLVTRGD